MSNLKVEGKISDWCPKCKNCKGTTRESNGVHVWLTEVECEDPYDGMTKTLQADSDICCSMFEPKPPCETCERFDGTYCHSPKGIYVTSYMGLFGDYTTGNCPLYEEKKEPHETKTAREIELEARITALLSEKAAHLKDIERLKKSQEKLQNQVKNLQTTNEESYKREEKLEDKVHKLERRLLDENKRRAVDNEFLMSIAHILYPDETVFKSQDEILTDIKLLNKGIYDLKEDNKRLADKNKALFEENLDRLDKHTKQCQEIDKLKNETDNLNEEKKSLTDMVKRRDRWIDVLKADIDGLQTDMLKISKIRDIAQKVCDDTNRD